MRRETEGGQLLVLGGVVLVLAFLLAAFAVSEIAAEKQRLARGAEGDIPRLFRDTREKLADTMEGLSYASMDNATFLTLFNATAADLQQQGRGHGVQVEVRLAAGAEGVAPVAERLNLTDAGGTTTCGGGVQRLFNANASAYDGTRDFNGLAWDCGDDGILWDYVDKRIEGFVVFLYASDRSSRLEQTLVMAVN